MSNQDKTELGKYRIVGQVGEGAMGVVYRAIDPVLNRTVAIKVMSDGIARDDDLRGRFLREAQAAGSLQHPNVITIYDCGEVDGHLFIAMEFVEGHDLESLLSSHTKMTLVTKIDIIMDVLSGLAYAHKRGIVHRDIKPANIRIDEEGRARIMDFGIAHLQSSSLTRTGVIVGTPAYMAPEQITGQAVSQSTDIFSVGAVFYELVSGVRPFNADTLQSVMYKIVSEAPPDLTKLHADLPPVVNTIIQRALAKDPKERYATATDMANDLAQARGGLDRTAIMRSVSLRSVIDTRLTGEREAAAGKAAAKQRRGVMIGGGVGVVALIVAVAFFVRGRSSASQSLTAGGAGAPTATVPPSPTPSNAATQTGQPPVAAAPTPAPAEPSATESKPAEAKSANQNKKTQKAAPAPVSPPLVANNSKNASGTKTGPTAEEIALFRSLRNNAMDARRRAAEAGAGQDQLQSGDNHTQMADSLIQQGKVAEAADHLNQATAAWSAAERDARAAAAAAARTRTAVVEPPKPQAPPATASNPPVSAPVAAPQPVPAVNPSIEIQAAAAAYAHAIESRDIAEVRRVYTGITSAQSSGFEQFFGTLRSLKATFSVTELEVNGTAAEARMVGEYNYVTNAGKTERTPVNFHASFRRDGNGWKLTSVR